MLDGLDLIDWASLTHAYGSAGDVPELLRALASSDEVQRKQAIYELFGNIWHQGTVYPATAAAVPFLYGLLNESNVLGKSEIAGLIASIATGCGYLQVHAVDEFGGRTWRKILSDTGRSLEDEVKREAAETFTVRQAAKSRLLDLMPYMRDPTSEIRRAVVEAFGNYPEYAPETLPELRKLAETDDDAEVLDALTESLGRLEVKSI